MAHPLLLSLDRGTSRQTVPQGNSMKSELIILRGLYAMTALVVVFGICALLLRAH
jgi:hypothetical protein